MGYDSVLTTYPGANEVGAWRLPEESYTVDNPVLCGHIRVEGVNYGQDFYYNFNVHTNHFNEYFY